MDNTLSNTGTTSLSTRDATTAVAEIEGMEGVLSFRDVTITLILNVSSSRRPSTILSLSTIIKSEAF